MTSVQRTIKYIAVAFALFLSVSIIAGIAMLALKSAAGIMILTNGEGFQTGINIDFDGDEIMFNDEERTSFTREFTTEEQSKITNLNISNNSCQLTVVPGTSLKVEAQDVPKRLEVEIRNGNTLWIGYKGNNSVISIFNFTGFNTIIPKIKVTLPQQMELNSADFNIGSGSGSIESIHTETMSIKAGSGRTVMQNIQIQKSLSINSGSGSVELNQVTAENTNINGGSGRIVANNGNLGDLNINSGSGSVSIDGVHIGDFILSSGSGRVNVANGLIEGNIHINSSSGSVTLQTKADIEEYAINCDTGSGGVWINGVKVSDGYRVTPDIARYRLNVDSGSGRVTVELNR